MEILVGVLTGVSAALGVALVFALMRVRSKPSITVSPGGLQSLQRVGELVVLRANWSIPATGTDHVFGDLGKKFLKWLWSENKTIMIFRFEIRFKYDLRDSKSVKLTSSIQHELEVRLGKPAHEISLSDVRFFHTENGQLLDWLLPRALNIFTSEMDDSNRQQIMEAAQDNARKEAEMLAAQLRPDAQLSAQSTLTALGKSAGFDTVRFIEEGREEPAPAAAAN